MKLGCYTVIICCNYPFDYFSCANQVVFNYSLFSTCNSPPSLRKMMKKFDGYNGIFQDQQEDSSRTTFSPCSCHAFPKQKGTVG